MLTVLFVILKLSKIRKNDLNIEDLFITGRDWGSWLTCPFSFFRFKKSMVKGLDTYEEKEDEVIKEVS